MPQTEVVKQPFGSFSWWITVAIIAIIFCIMYFYVRRRKPNPPQVDQKAGDEGED